MRLEGEARMLAAVGRRIRKARTGQGLSLEQVARVTGVNAPALSLLETGKRDARLTTLARIAAALHVCPAQFLSDEMPRTACEDEDKADSDLNDCL